MNTTERKMQRLAAEVVGVSCGDILQVRFEVQRLHDEGEPIVPPHEQLLNALQAVKNRHGDVDGAIAEVVRAHCGAALLEPDELDHHWQRALHKLGSCDYG